MRVHSFSMRRARLLLVLASVLAGLAVTAVSLASREAKATVTTVNVKFSDLSFKLNPSVLHAGPTTFVVSNDGKRKHAFAVSGPGLKNAWTGALAAGKTAKLTVTLRAGSYMLSDPVGLGPYSVQYVSVVPAESLTASGGSSVTSPTVTLPAMCGSGYNP
jgi:plastocyanin